MKQLFLLLLLAASTFAQGTVSINGTAYNYVGHPRLMLDGPSGPLTTAIKDPDGSGAQVAPKASPTNPPYAAMIAKIRPLVASYPPSAQPVGDEWSVDILLAALDWFSDNSQTNSLNAAIYWLDHVELTQGPYQFACDQMDGNSKCGVGSWADWPSYSIAQVAQAYSLVRSQMTPSERTAFSQKMLNDIDGAGCTNQLQALAGVSITSTASSAIVTGSGFSGKGLASGDQVYLKKSNSQTTGSWGTIQSVDSDTQITLTASAGQDITAGVLLKIMPWTSTTCSITWMLKSGYGYSPANTIGRFAATTNTGLIDTVQTTIAVADATVFAAAPLPFYAMLLSGEMIQVTAINGNNLTVVRAQLGSSPTSSYYGKSITYRPYPLSGSTSGEYAHNLVVQKLYGYITVALATLEDNPTAAGLLLDQAGTSWLRDTLPQEKSMITGFHSAGSSYYTGRQAGLNSELTAMFKNSLGVDQSSGNWIKNFAYYTLYNSTPGSNASVIPWGQSDVAENYLYLGDRLSIPSILGLYPGSNEAKYLDFWQRSYANQYTTPVLTSMGGGLKVIAPEYVFNTETGSQIDFRTVLPTQWAFNTVDGTPDRAIKAWISRTGWNAASDSLVFASAYDINYTLDHLGTGNPASYKIWKNGWVLDEASTAKKTGEGLSSNMIVFGGAANLKTSAQFQDTSLTAGGDPATASSWAYTKIDATNAYVTTANVQRALRHILHLKAPGTQDYVIVYDDTASSVGTSKAINLYYDKTSGETSAMTTAALPNLVWTGPNRRLSTKVLLPTTAALTSTSPTYGYKQYVCASLDGSTCDGTNTTAEFLVVHRPSPSVSDTMPAVALLTSDANFRVVQVDAPDSKVAVFPRSGGPYPSTTFTSAHSGSAQYFVSGLNIGTYQVMRNGVPILTGQNVTSDGTLAFAAASGAFSINQNGPQPPVITTVFLASGYANHAYSQILTATGDAPITWSIIGGTLPAGLSLNATTGAITGTPTATGARSFTVRATNLAGKDERALTITTNSVSSALVGAIVGSRTTVQ